MKIRMCLFLVVLLIFTSGCATSLSNISLAKQTISTTNESDQSVLSSSVPAIDSNTDSSSSLNQSETTKASIDSSETEPYYISGQFSRAIKFETAKSLSDAAENIFAGRVISSKPAFYDGFLFTLSCIEIERVFKGNLNANEIIYVGELGGKTTYADYSKYIPIEKKIFEETTKPISPDREVREHYEGYSPMNTGDKVLLYVNLETSIDINKIMGYEKYPAISYYIVGINDGRLFQIDNTTFVKPKPSRFGERTIESFENGGSLTITLDELKD